MQKEELERFIFFDQTYEEAAASVRRLTLTVEPQRHQQLHPPVKLRLILFKILVPLTALGRPSSNGRASKYRRLYLFGDLVITLRTDLYHTVSRNDTTESHTIILAPPMKSSGRSFRQTSRCNSPAPAMTCSPLSSIIHNTMGSDFARRFRPSTSFGRSNACLHCTAARTTGDTENFIARMGCNAQRVGATVEGTSMVHNLAH